jgi:hypothetical protein
MQYSVAAHAAPLHKPPPSDELPPEHARPMHTTRVEKIRTTSLRIEL